MNDKTDIRWLAVGALAGLIAAGYGMLRQASTGTDLPDSAIASVNDSLIGRDDLERALGRMSVDPARDTDDDRALLLQRLIDDELLVQRGVELGMMQSDLEVRNAIVNSLVASITAEADASSPGDDELGAYLAANADRFSYTSRLAVEAWETEDESLAQNLIAMLRTDGTGAPADGIRAMPDLPSGLMTTDILRNYLGPAITAAAADMPEGSSAVFARRGRWLVVRVTAKERTRVTDLGTIRNRVLLDYRRSLADEMLRRYIDNLRQRANIRVARP